MLENIVVELMTQQEPSQILALCTKEELAELASLQLPVSRIDNYLSMQHLCSTQNFLGKERKILAVIPNEEITTEAERALIYAMLIRSRKVISCRDKLEDMLKYDNRDGWGEYKKKYETKVLDLYKASWKDSVVYPYNIVDNIKEYNKDEGYILKALYTHLSERIPGKINPGDVEMTQKLRKMFSDISVAILKPQIVIVGKIDAYTELVELAGKYSQDTSVRLIKIH